MSAPDGLRPPALTLRAITKRFDRTVALDNADLVVRAGTLHALLGENGAGKTTLMRVAFGMLRPDSGDIFVNGTKRLLRSSADAIDARIGMVHQHFLVVDAMTVAENVELGVVARSGPFTGFDRQQAAASVRQLGVQTGLTLDPSALAADLSAAARQRLELLKALARDARILILDEPTSLLAPAEAADLYRTLRAFADTGGTVVVVTHKLNDALGFADDVTVLRRGKTVLTGPAASLGERELVRALLGDRDTVAATARGSTVGIGATVLGLDDVSVKDATGVVRLRSASLQVHAGEVVGLLGVDGSGQQELLRVLAGRLSAFSGRVTRPASVGFVPADRLRDALIPSLSLVENAALAGAGESRGRMPWTDLTNRVEVFIRRLEIVADGPAAVAGSLSGGNQQKFVLARELSAAQTALVVENPSGGLDVRAAEQVQSEIVRAAREQGVAVLFYSNDFDEVLRVADRIYVSFAGSVKEMPVGDPTAIARAMVGAD